MSGGTSRARLLARREVLLAKLRDVDGQLDRIERAKKAREARRAQAIREQATARRERQRVEAVERRHEVIAIAETVAKATARVTLAKPTARALLDVSGATVIMGSAQSAVAILARKQGIQHRIIASAMHRATTTVYSMLRRSDEPMVARILAAASEVQP